MEMRMIVLGGAGDMGQRAVRTLAAYPEVSTITIADKSVSRAVALARELGGPPRIDIQAVDVTNAAALAAALTGYQVAISAVGPFYKFEVPCARAALAAGVDYVSLCDDYDAAQAVLALDAEARAAGCRVLTGMGWTPGLSNVLARKGVQQMDRAEEVDIAWAGSAADSRGLAVVLHTIHIFTGRVPAWMNGREVRVPAGSGALRLPFPAPLGEVKVFHVGHPEPVTIPRFLPDLRQVTLRGGLTEPFLNRLGLALAGVGLTNSVRKKDWLGRLIFRVLPLLERLGPAGTPCSGLRVEVRGYKGGRRVRLVFAIAAHMEMLTGVPLALAAILLGRGQVKRQGVFAPEADGAIDPAAFLALLADHGLRVHEVIEDETAPRSA